jgi:hypothetical protein
VVRADPAQGPEADGGGVAHPCVGRHGRSRALFPFGRRRGSPGPSTSGGRVVDRGWRNQRRSAE